MAVSLSHQWLFEWSAPAMVIADISQQFDIVSGVNSGTAYTNWDYTEPKREVPTSVLSFYESASDHDMPTVPLHKQPLQKIHYGYGPVRSSYHGSGRKQKPKVNSSAPAAALTLWMSMLGAARAQPPPPPARADTPPFTTLYQWTHVDFLFPSQDDRERAIAAGSFIPENVLPLGLEVWGPRVWVTLPSWRRGVPATLATVPRAGGRASPPLEPYPDWTYHRAFSTRNCTGLTSVFRINADPCGRLWVLDTGQINSQDEPKQICPPSIVVFDLSTDKLIARYTIPKRYVLQDSLFSNIIVDTREKNCADLHVYIADTWRFGLLVFRETDMSFWRFSHHLFYPDPLASNFTLHGLNFQWADGIFGLALTPLDRSDDRTLFFHSMSSYREFYVSTSILRQPGRVNSSSNEFKFVGESRGLFGQSSASAIDRRGVMFYGLVLRDSIGCWDTRKSYKKNTLGVVAMNAETMVFPNDIKVDQDMQQSVWVISNRLPMFQAGELSPQDYNYRLLYANTLQAVRNTVCDPAIPDKSLGGKLPLFLYTRF